MKKIIILFSMLMFVFQHHYGQDIIKTKSGEEKKARLINLDRKAATYKGADDPEFSTYTIPYEELETIQKEGAKKPIYFNHNLPRAYLVGSFGASIPMGSFSKTEYDNSDVEPGFAKTGVLASFEAGFYILKRLGVNIGIGSIINRFDYGNYGNQFLNTPDQVYDVYEIGDEPTDWHSTYFMIGPMYSVKLSKRLTWDINGKVGFLKVQKPSVQINFNDYINFDDETYYYSYDPNSTIGYGGGTNIRFALSKRLALFVSGNYLYSNPTITAEISDAFTNAQGFTVNAEIDHKISVVNLNLGLAFQFKRKGNKYE